MNIAVIGTGYVGLVVGAALAENGNTVICVDKDESKVGTLNAGKITIRHGPIKKLGMDHGMTMVFSAQDAAMLKGVKAGDRVKFDAEDVNGDYIVTRIEKAK